MHVLVLLLLLLLLLHLPIIHMSFNTYTNRSEMSGVFVAEDPNDLVS